MIHLEPISAGDGYGHPSVYFSICLDDQVIGRIGIFTIDKKDFSDIFIEAEHRGKGYMRVAYQLLIKALKLKRLYAYINVNNEVSLKAHQNLGFRMLGCGAGKYVLVWRGT